MKAPKVSASAKTAGRDGGAEFSDPDKARIVEVFNSLQGEGTRLGERQIFVRFGGCNLHCDYCDEPDTIPIPSGEVWPRAKLEREILRLAAEKRPRSISWTGGEPLLHATFLEKSLAWARAQGFQNYLETNGVLAAALPAVAPLCDVIAMDLKLPSATGRELWSAHHAFLKIAPDKTFVKVVLTRDSNEREWRQAIRLLQEAGPQIPLILQPATAAKDSRGTGKLIEPIEPERAVAFLRQARGLLKVVRLVPQWHPVWALP
ncbi:MAG: 7-carboxy-7-deazaguanine synthase QueE [Elusimicrobia bacterium]|nr:7-carboxy-7-deazaguanine synthase QueE [Elusimicrobiota bacterium]